MVEAGPPEPAGKTKRVVGMFILMLGSGIVLESSATVLGAVLTLVGVVTLMWGLAEAGLKERMPYHEQGSRPAPAAHPTESNP